MHEQIAREMYYFSIHLLYASIVGAAAWVLTSLRRASATTKYWIWVVTAFNFVVPSEALIDKLWAPNLNWASPLGAIGSAIWDVTEGRKALLLGMIWTAGTLSMVVRLMCRIHSERHETKAVAGSSCVTSNFMARGIPVSFGEQQTSPSVHGILYPRILLPVGIDRLLSQPEFDAVLLHELAHAKRRDNLIRLLYELSLCALWFHPLVWLAGTRLALYRELSCDECVIKSARGQALVSALAKLAVPPPQALFLQATASSHLSYRLARLAGSERTANFAASLLMTSIFSAIVMAGVFETVAHTACCFILKR